MGGRKAVVFAVNNPFTAALNPNHGTPNSAGISARVVRFMRTRGGHDPTQGRRSESEKTEIDSESCGVTVDLPFNTRGGHQGLIGRPAPCCWWASLVLGDLKPSVMDSVSQGGRSFVS